MWSCLIVECAQVEGLWTEHTRKECDLQMPHGFKGRKLCKAHQHVDRGREGVPKGVPWGSMDAFIPRCPVAESACRDPGFDLYCTAIS